MVITALLLIFFAVMWWMAFIMHPSPFSSNIPKRIDSIKQDLNDTLDNEPLTKKELPMKKQPESEKKDPVTGNTQKIDSGGSGIQNNAPNYGNQAGRDMYVSNERELTAKELKEILDGVAAYISLKGLKKTIIIAMSRESNGRKVSLQLIDALTKAGYTVYPGGTVMSTGIIQGIQYNYTESEKYMTMDIGVIPDPD